MKALKFLAITGALLISSVSYADGWYYGSTPGVNYNFYDYGDGYVWYSAHGVNGSQWSGNMYVQPQHNNMRMYHYLNTDSGDTAICFTLGDDVICY